MEVGFFLAKAWSLYMVLIGVGFLINKNGLKKMVSVAQDDGFIFMTGFIALILGILHVLSFNMWEPDWRGLVTLLGWITLIKGFTRIAWPTWTKKMTKSFAKKNLDVWMWVVIAIGLYLGYVAWWA